MVDEVKPAGEIVADLVRAARDGTRRSRSAPDRDRGNGAAETTARTLRDELAVRRLLPTLTFGLVLGALEVVLAISLAALIFGGPLSAEPRGRDRARAPLRHRRDGRRRGPEQPAGDDRERSGQHGGRARADRRRDRRRRRGDRGRALPHRGGGDRADDRRDGALPPRARPPSPRQPDPLHAVPGGRRLPGRDGLVAGEGRDRRARRPVDVAVEPRRRRSRETWRRSGCRDWPSPWCCSRSCAASQHVLLLPAALLASFALFYVVAAASRGQASRSSKADGWLLGPFPGTGLWEPWAIQGLDDADWSAIVEQLPNMATVALVGAVALLLNTSGIELTVDRELDLNRELRASGGANVVAGLGGGIVGFPALSLTALAHRSGSRPAGRRRRRPRMPARAGESAARSCRTSRASSSEASCCSWGWRSCSSGSTTPGSGFATPNTRS